MTVLVVGGAGYIGSHTCKALKKAGFNPVVYDNFQNGHKWACAFGPLVVGDIQNTELLSQTLKTYKPQVVLHFASSIDARASMTDPSSYYYNNLAGTVSLLQAMQQNGIENLVFSSTAAVYGTPKSGPLNERSKCDPLNVYGKTKWMTEQMIHDFEAAYGMKSVILRYFNAAGADSEGDLGEAHSPETHLIPLAILSALGKEPHLNVFGDGTAVRDYIHVMDLADAHVKAVQWLLSGKGPMTFNLGSGTGYSLLDVLEMVEKVSQKPVKKVIQPKKMGEPLSLIADATKARALMGWDPLHSNLETIVSSAFSWHQKDLA